MTTQNGELMLDESTTTVMAVVGCLLMVAQFVAEHEPEHAALMRAMSKKLVANIPSDALKDIVDFVIELVHDDRIIECFSVPKMH